MAKVLNENFYTYKDYMNFPEGERVELIDGQIFAMSPAPSSLHQTIVLELATLINNYIKQNNSACKVFIAPFDVRLDSEEDNETCQNVVQPDISVVCDKSKIDERGLKGAPDLIIEVVSPSSVSIDYVKKLNLYERFGVREYWIVNPNMKTVTVYRLDENVKYGEPEKFNQGDKVKVGIFEDLAIELDSIF